MSIRASCDIIFCMLKISPLFSGSKGNCTLIRSDRVNLLLDIGFTYRSVVEALAERGLEPSDIDAIVITHEHADHIAALPMWTRRTDTPVYAPQGIVDLIAQRAYSSEVTGIADDFRIGDVTVSRYECCHDSVCCFGYKFICGDSRFACVTDTGRVDGALADFLRDCNAVMLESNHDEAMLINGEYAYPLKRRILSPRGHLSNAQTAEVLRRLAHSSVRTVILAHLSEKNNMEELAFKAAVEACADCGLVEGRDIVIYVANQNENGFDVCLD